jgi:hypothetical protein
MLSELLFAAVASRGKEPRPDRAPGISCSSLFPCPYRLYKAHIGEIWKEVLTPQQILNMRNGWFAEEESVQLLKEAGIIIKDRQERVTVGRSEIPGKIDGKVELDSKYLWEHKAWGDSGYDWFVANGIEAFPGEKAQVNAYLLGTGLDKCIFYVKRKENNDYHDEVVCRDEAYILPILEWADRIRLDGWVPEPELTGICARCGVGCFGTILDLSWIKEAKASEVADKWRQGKQLSDVGTFMMDEARTVLTGQVKVGDKWLKKAPGLIGDESLLLVEGLKVQKITQHRFEVRKEDVFRVFGIDGLMNVGHEKDIVQYKITEA